MPFGYNEQQPTSPPQNNSTDNENGSVLDPVKQLSVLDSAVDKAFEDIISTLDNDSNTILNTVTSIQLNDIAKNAIPLSKKKNQSFDTKVKNKIAGIDSSLLESLSNISIPQERLKRYELYSDIINNVPLASRMLQVYIDNILIKNPYTKQFIDVLPSEEVENNKKISDSDKKTLVNFVKTLASYFKIQKRLKSDILPLVLRYGNFFVEIVNFHDLQNINREKNSVRVLMESVEDKEKHVTEISFSVAEILGYEHATDENTTVANMTLEEQIKILFKDEVQYLDEQSRYLYEEVTDEISTDDVIDTIRSIDLLKLREIQLNYISPENVIILRNHGIDYGYLVIETEGKRNGFDENNINSIQQIVSRVKGTDKKNKSDSEISREYVDKIVTDIFKKIRQNFKITTNAELLQTIEDEETRFALQNIIYDKYKKYAQLKVRYVPPNKMTNYTINIDKYTPYGTSIFDSILLPAKLYLLGMLSSIISRLNRAAVIRKWTIEVGAHRNHSEIVEKFKQELRNNTITVNDIAELNDVSNLLTDYKDVVTVQQNGRRFVDMDLMPVHDRSLPMNELDQLKRELIEATGVPSSYLNVTDTIELREQLVQININFANTINGIQSYINDANEALIDAIFSQLLLNNNVSTSIKLSRYIDIKLNPPLLLTLQHLEGTVSTVSNLVNLLTTMQIPIDPVWMLKRFIKIVDWDAVRNAGLEYTKEATINQTIQQQTQTALGGTGSGGGGF